MIPLHDIHDVERALDSARLRGRTREVVREILTTGKPAYTVCKAHALGHQNVYRALALVRRNMGRCPFCGTRQAAPFDAG